MDDERTREEALGAAALAGLKTGAEILDCPTGFGRHALALTAAGYIVTGFDRSETLLAEGERQRGDADRPRLVHGDYRELPFDDASFDAVFNLFTSLGYLERDEDIGVLQEFRRVLRADGALVLETAHRDGFARFTRTPPMRTWDNLSDGSLFLQESEVDWSTGTVSALHAIVTPHGERIERRFVHRVYSVKEWTEMLHEAGFSDVEGFSAWDGVTPSTPAAWRLILCAR